MHAADLELARLCAAGDPAAWDRFVLEYRPVLYRAADALNPHGNAREIADALYAELYGITDAKGDRLSLFRYFHGRSSLATWLRAVLAQRHVDAVRARKRIEPLSEAEGPEPSVDPAPADPDRERLVECVRQAIRTAMAQLDPRDRLR